MVCNCHLHTHHRPTCCSAPRESRYRTTPVLCLAHTANLHMHICTCSFSTSEILVVKDKFPKARCHWLVMPRFLMKNLHLLRVEHLSLLKVKFSFVLPNTACMPLCLCMCWAVGEGWVCVRYQLSPSRSSRRVSRHFQCRWMAQDMQKAALEVIRRWVPTLQLLPSLLEEFACSLTCVYAEEIRHQTRSSSLDFTQFPAWSKIGMIANTVCFQVPSFSLFRTVLAHCGIAPSPSVADWPASALCVPFVFVCGCSVITWLTCMRLQTQPAAHACYQHRLRF